MKKRDATEEALQKKQLAGVNVIVTGRFPLKPQQCFVWSEKEKGGQQSPRREVCKNDERVIFAFNQTFKK